MRSLVIRPLVTARSIAAIACGTSGGMSRMSSPASTARSTLSSP
jgi:hypothetical protein